VRIADLGAIGSAHADTLVAAGVETTDDLLQRARSREDRHQLGKDTGIRDSLLLRWTNHAELMAIDGVGHEYATLLEAAGVYCADELGQRDPHRLAESMADLIAARATLRHIPEVGEIAYWIAQAQRRAQRVEQ
jgi:hypothetical protein